MYNSNISIRVYKDDKEKFKDITKQDNKTMSEVIREAIKKYIEKDCNK